mgnify:CR=1 FL=1
MGRFSLSGSMSKLSSTLGSAPNKVNQAVSRGLGNFKNTVNANASNIAPNITGGLSEATAQLSKAGGSAFTSEISSFASSKAGELKSELASKLQAAVNVDVADIGLDKAIDVGKLDLGDLSGLEQAANIDFSSGTSMPNFNIKGSNISGSDINAVIKQADADMKSESDKASKSVEDLMSNPLDAFKK